MPNCYKIENFEDLKRVSLLIENGRLLDFYGNQIDNFSFKLTAFGIDGEQRKCFKSFFDALKISNKAAELDLSDSNIFRDQLLGGIFLDFLKKNPSLTILNLANTEPNKEQIEALAKFLKTSQNLSNLNLSDNNLSSNSLKLIIESLKYNPNLISLNLSLNAIYKSGLRIITQYLLQNNILRELDLSYNQIDSDGVIKLMNALRGNTNLKKLNLASNNVINDSSIENSVDVFHKNLSLQFLGLENNLISADSEKLLKKIIGLNKFLQEFDQSLDWQLMLFSSIGSDKCYLIANQSLNSAISSLKDQKNLSELFSKDLELDPGSQIIHPSLLEFAQAIKASSAFDDLEEISGPTLFYMGCKIRLVSAELFLAVCGDNSQAVFANNCLDSSVVLREVKLQIIESPPANRSGVNNNDDIDQDRNISRPGLSPRPASSSCFGYCADVMINCFKSVLKN